MGIVNRLNRNLINIIKSFVEVFSGLPEVKEYIINGNASNDREDGCGINKVYNEFINLL